MTASPMDGLSKEERRQRALDMLKAKPRPEAKALPKPVPAARAGRVTDSAREKELAARERELQEQARRLDELERQREREAEETERRREAQELERARQEELDAREYALEEQARALEERERQLAEDQTARASSGPAAVAPRGHAPPAPNAKSEAPMQQTPMRRRSEAQTEPLATAPAAQKRKRKVGAPLLEVDTVDVHYGKIQALRSLNLSIKQGEVVALLGANGAGKSSTLRAISGMIAPSAGTIVFDGEPIGGRPSYEVVKHGISHVPEGRELFPTLAVEENLRLGYWPQRKTGGRTLKEALDRVYTMFPRLGERRAQAAGTMSGGEQQMLAFGRALMSSPRLLLVDEMSLGLAPLIVQTLFDAVEQIHSEGASVIIVEQFVHKALKHAQRAYVLSKGEIILEAPSSKLANDPKLLAAYLGGAEGHIEEEVATPAASGAHSARPKASSATGPKPRK